MSRLLLCAALVAMALATAAPPARADHCVTRVDRYCCGPFDFVGFFDYRRSLDCNDDPGYRRYRRHLDRDLDYAFHCMSPREASEVWYGGGCGGRWRGGEGCGDARRVRSIGHWGGGEHHHSWGVHESDHGD